MNFAPEKFFIGLVDFFSIIMPGALLTYLGKDWVGTRLGLVAFPLSSTENGMVFLFASYLLGHFAFLFGALLDEWLYDPLRSGTYWGQVRRLAQDKNLSRHWLRALAASNWLFGKNADVSVMRAQRIKARAVHALAAEGAINAYQWCKARLSREHPAGLVTVQRFEADSKFFRSFVVVLMVLALFYAFRREPIRAAICAAGVLPALWRYIDERFKATQHAYWFVITLEAANAMPIATTIRKDGLTHAGGVVIRTKDGATEYLLVQASHDREKWVLPKGHIEPGEDPRETAAREVIEESGNWARVEQWLDDVCFTTPDGSDAITRFYLMEAEQSSKTWPAENRRHEWLPLPAALKQATFPETRTLLELAAASHKRGGITYERNRRTK